jgi:hypothetical protein
MTHAPEPAADDPAAIVPPIGEPTADTASTVGPQGVTAPNVGPQGERAPALLPADAEPAPIAETVYAPASERVPMPPAPGYADLVSHVDPTTPERQRQSGDRWYADTAPIQLEQEQRARSGRMVWWVATWLLAVVGTVAILRWLDARQRERNRPTARLRRQAQLAVGSLAPARAAAADRLQPAQRRVRSFVP